MSHRQMVRVSTVTVVVTVAVLRLAIRFVPGQTERDVPLAGRDDLPTTELAEIDPAELADLAADRGLVGIAGTRQLYDGDQVFLRFWDEDQPWARVALAELSSARGEPVPGSADPRAQLELVARADEAVLSGVVEVGTGVLSLGGVELARITAVADVSATLGNLRAELEALDAAGEEPGPDALQGRLPVGALLEEVRVHDGRLPIEPPERDETVSLDDLPDAPFG